MATARGFRVWVLPGAIALGLATLLAPAALAQVEIDPDLPSYSPVQGISGSLKSVGSDTMNNLMTLWAEGFRAHYPNVTIEIEGKGTATAPPALVAGTADFGCMSRPMKKQEEDEFEAKYGYKPILIGTSIDMLAVFVHKDNPIESLTLQQVDAIFSKTRKLGYDSDIRTWGDAGLTDAAWIDRPISLYGRNAASGTYGFFKDHVLGKGDYKDSVKEQPGSSAVVQGVAGDKSGIGYSGIGYATADVRAVPLAEDEDADPVPAEPEHALTGDYPLSRFLFLAMNYKPNSELDPLRREFVTYILSREGQEVVIQDGYFPMTATMAKKALASLGIKVKAAAGGP